MSDEQNDLRWQIGSSAGQADKDSATAPHAVAQNGRRVILSVQDLITRFYSIDGVVHALNKVGFELFEGETLAVVGESGSGKSVTMMSLVGLIPQPPGKVEGGQALLFDDQDVIDLLALSDDQLRRVRGGQIGFIFQDPISSLNPTMTIGRQIAESMIEHLGLGQSTARSRTISLLRQVGIADAERRYSSYPHEFSGGMRQRVMIAIAAACEPRIIIADEPTTALDVTVQAQIVELIKLLQEQLDVAVIWITHDLGVVAGIADRVIVMYGGTVVENALVDDLYENPQHPYTLGLLGAIPHVDDRAQETTETLASIEGTPPDLLEELTFCPFAPRCKFVMDRCWASVPPLVSVGPHHYSACYYDLARGSERENG